MSELIIQNHRLIIGNQDTFNRSKGQKEGIAIVKNCKGFYKKLGLAKTVSVTVNGQIQDVLLNSNSIKKYLRRHNSDDLNSLLNTQKKTIVVFAQSVDSSIEDQEPAAISAIAPHTNFTNLLQNPPEELQVVVKTRVPNQAAKASFQNAVRKVMVLNEAVTNLKVHGANLKERREDNEKRMKQVQNSMKTEKTYSSFAAALTGKGNDEDALQATLFQLEQDKKAELAQLQEEFDRLNYQQALDDYAPILENERRMQAVQQKMVAPVVYSSFSSALKAPKIEVKKDDHQAHLQAIRGAFTPTKRYTIQSACRNIKNQGIGVEFDAAMKEDLKKVIVKEQTAAHQLRSKVLPELLGLNLKKQTRSLRPFRALEEKADEILNRTILTSYLYDSESTDTFTSPVADLPLEQSTTRTETLEKSSFSGRILNIVSQWLTGKK